MSKFYRIFPGIGIARVGNAPEAFYIGPEAPGFVPDAGGAYRDGKGRLKRQGARFRIYEYERDEFGRSKVVREITEKEAEIRWSVHLVNSKAAGSQFPPQNNHRRNDHTNDRGSLIIDTDWQEIQGVDKTDRPDMKGQFKGKDVKLGNLQTDSEGRLIVLGGHGCSSSIPETEIRNFANNKNWYDDVSDGPVRATVQFSGSEPLKAEPSWVVVAPPAYAPSIENVTTWFDQAQNVNAQVFHPLEMTRQPSFTKDIYPVLRRVVLLQWTSATARRGHQSGSPGDFLQSEKLKKLADDSDSNKKTRKDVFRRIVEPDTKASASSLPRGQKNMPYLRSGVNPKSPKKYVYASLTDLQYKQFERWLEGDFIADWKGHPDPIPFDKLPLAERPEALNQAALQACIGGPFFPGIETGFVMAQVDTYEAPFRIDQNTSPGHLTQGLAVPWQADFYECGQMWWPAQRPVEVNRKGRWKQYLPKNWSGYEDMIENWWKLGFVLEYGDTYTEQQRDHSVDT